MLFDDLLKQYETMFPANGSFDISSGNELRTQIAETRVPNKPGCYLIYSNVIENSKLIYIGKAGTMKNNGVFKDQGLAKRLCAKQDKKSRSQFFQEVIEAYALNSLIFQWFVTFDSKSKIIPAKAESDLLQAYYNSYGKLPLLNVGI